MKTYKITTMEFLRLKRTPNESVDCKVGFRSIDFDVEIRVFSSREYLAKTIRKQEKKPDHYLNWKALIPLKDNEGY
jgi:nicotinic acid phosphoribosyltransferase